MRSDIAAAVLEKRDNGGNGGLETCEVNVRQPRHHYIWLVTLCHSLEKFFLHDYLADVPCQLVRLFNKCCLRLTRRFFRRLEQDVNSAAQTGECVGTGMRPLTYNADFCPVARDIKVGAILLALFKARQQLRRKPDVVREHDHL